MATAMMQVRNGGDSDYSSDGGGGDECLDSGNILTTSFVKTLNAGCKGKRTKQLISREWLGKL